MSNKICPNCQTTNSSNNLKCIKCSENMIYVLPEAQWTKEHENTPFNKVYMWEEFASFSFISRIILGICFAYAGISTMSPFLMGISIIVVGTFFIPKDFDYFSPVDWFDYFRNKSSKKATLTINSETKTRQPENIVRKPETENDDILNTNKMNTTKNQNMEQ